MNMHVASCQLPVVSKETARRLLSASPRPRVSASPPAQRTGFTLVEMLVVMGIIVLAITLAIPTIRYLTGSKSTQSAENVVAAVLARTRSDAIGLQQPEGVLFVLDQTTNRVTLLEVTQTVNSYDPPGITYLDLVPNRDPLVLPPGVGAWTIKDTYVPTGSSPTFTDPFGGASPNTNGYRYLGYNNDTTGTGIYTGSTVTDKAFIGGVILFDGQGNLLVTPYGFRFMNNMVAPAQPTALSQALITINPSSPPTSLPTLWPAGSVLTGTPPTTYLRSQIGFVLFDRETFELQQRQLSVTSGNYEGNPSGSNYETTLDPWLDVNTTPLLVNRYNGTLTRAE